MTRNILKKGLIILFTLLIYSLTYADKYDKKLYKPTPKDVTRFASLKELKAGRDTYIIRCTKCHGLVSPDRYTISDWQIVVNKMSPRAHLTPQETNVLYKYVTRGQ
ncbi:MAG: hypothetical protein ACOYOT_07870 [Bacteroidales bacterium]